MKQILEDTHFRHMPQFAPLIFVAQFGIYFFKHDIEFLVLHHHHLLLLLLLHPRQFLFFSPYYLHPSRHPYDHFVLPY